MAVKNRPLRKFDSNYDINPYSYQDQALQIDYLAGTNPIYIGSARPGASTAEPIWQIKRLTFDVNNNVTMIQWPLRADGSVSSDYEFIWNNRAALTYV